MMGDRAGNEPGPKRMPGYAFGVQPNAASVVFQQTGNIGMMQGFALYVTAPLH